MKIKEIKIYLLQNYFDKLELAEVEKDLFFMHKKTDKFPFATLITRTMSMTLYPILIEKASLD